MSEVPFRERFAIERFADGGIVADLATGAYSRLNPTATTICEVLSEIDDGGSARAVIAQRLRIPIAEASRATSEIEGALTAPAPRQLRRDPFMYGPAGTDGGYLLSHGVRPRLWVSPDGLAVRAASADELGPEERFHCLRAVAPKVLFLRGLVVIHGAACQGTRGAAAFCGDSGAGKTTTARAFDAAGAKLLGEDMLVVASAAPLTFHRAGEEAIRAWAMEEAENLRRSPEIETSRLAAATAGPPVPITEIFFIAAGSRIPDSAVVQTRRLGSTDGALAVMASLFLGATTPAEWRRFLSYAATIARTPINLMEARLPDGLAALRTGVAAYMENSAW